MLERIWTNILLFVSQFVTPDWGKLIFFMPVAIVLAVLAGLLWIFAMLRKGKPARRGTQRIPPKTPAGVHMPGPTLAPVFGAVGVFLVLLGLVVGGITVVLGLIALALTLLYWLAEGIRNYDHDIGATGTTVPAVVHDGPPPGVHMPGPSWRPFLGAFGLFAVMLGLVFGEWVLAAGIIALISTLVGWMADAIQEYRKTVQADTTGHLENIPEPRSPRRLLAVLTVLILGAAVLQSGIFAGSSANGGTGAPGASGAPSGSGAPAGSGGPPASGVTGDVTLEAKGVAFVQTTWTGPAGKPFTIAFDNEDPGTPHNVEIQDGTGAVVFKGDIFNGVATKIYQVPALTAGSYKFLCIVHPTAMTGTATIQ